MGSWAAFANRIHPWPVPLFAFVIQGSLSALITLLLKRVVETTLESHQNRPWLAPLVAASVSATLLALAHLLAGTPEFWTTVTLPFCVATTYSSLYCWKLRQDA